MTKKEYTVNEPFELTATPISWLEGITPEELSSDDILLVVSQPNYQVQDTGFISKKAKLADIKESLAGSLSVDTIQLQIQDLSTNIDNLADIKDKFALLSSGSVYVSDASMQESDPYILSSLTYGSGNISALEGYKLKDALTAILPETAYSKLEATNLSCQSIKVNDQDLHPVQEATSTVPGTVLIADDTDVNVGNVVYVKKHSTNRKLYIDVGAIANSIKADIYQQLYSDILTAIQNEYFKTKVVTSLPQILDPKAIYYVTNSTN